MQLFTNKRLGRIGSLAIAGLMLGSSSLRAQQPGTPDRDDTYNQKIKEYTADKRFLPASVLNLPDDPKVPSPLKHFGQIIIQ